MPHRKNITPLRRAIIDGYLAGEHPAAIAAANGTTENAVRVTASLMRITSIHPQSKAKQRGFAIPAQFRDEYLRLRRNKHMTATEAGEALGLIPRKVA
jgi:hypothetical protein